jgi:hypothetical protein
VILKKCSLCSEMVAEGLTQATWAWNRADGVRVAYRQKLCLACTASVVVPLHVACESPVMTCPACGIDTADDMDPVYCTFFPRGLGRMHLEAPMCAVCAAHLRIKAQTGAELLEDRGLGAEDRSQAPRPNGASVWEALGLRSAGQ